MSKDPARVSAFYEKIFGWKIQHMLDYRMMDSGGAGGILKPERGALARQHDPVQDVDDLAAYRKHIVAAGGQIHVQEQEVPGMGRLCLFTDPEGRMLGLWKEIPAASPPERNNPIEKP
ncbi:MAG: VOC family protein [Gammaproteobacteria bacterium]